MTTTASSAPTATPPPPTTTATTTTASTTTTVATAWYRSLHVGDFLDVQDTDEVWREATVKSISETSVRVHFRGRADSTNKHVPLLDSKRLAPAYTKVALWRAFTKRQRVQVGTIAHKQRKPVWRNAVVLKVAASPEGIKIEHHATASATRSSSSTGFRVRVKLDGDGETRWMDAQSEFLSQANTHTTLFNTATPLEFSEDEEEDENEEEDKDKDKDKAEEGDSTATGEPGSSSSSSGSAMEPWRVELREGDDLEVVDMSSGSAIWYEARVADRCHDKICVRFRGWPWSFDEWLHISSERLAQHETHHGAWRRTLQTGHFVQIGFRVADHSDMASHWVVGQVVNRSTRKTTKALVRVEIKFTDRNGTCKSEWREIDDDFLAPLGVLTFPLPRKRKPQATSEKTKPVQEPEPPSSHVGGEANANGGRDVTQMAQPQPVRGETPAAATAEPTQADGPMPARLERELQELQRGILTLRGRFEQFATSCTISLDELQEQAEAIVASLKSHHEADLQSVPRQEPEPQGRPKRKTKRTKRG